MFSSKFKPGDVLTVLLKRKDKDEELIVTADIVRAQGIEGVVSDENHVAYGRRVNIPWNLFIMNMYLPDEDIVTYTMKVTAEDYRRELIVYMPELTKFLADVIEPQQRATIDDYFNIFFDRGETPNFNGIMTFINRGEKSVFFKAIVEIMDFIPIQKQVNYKVKLYVSEEMQEKAYEDDNKI
jgi:hypothetical protein